MPSQEVYSPAGNGMRQGVNGAKLPRSKFSRVQKRGSTLNQPKAFAGGVCSSDFKQFHLDLKS